MNTEAAKTKQGTHQAVEFNGWNLELKIKEDESNSGAVGKDDARSGCLAKKRC